jgi:hypothetical protein
VSDALAEVTAMALARNRDARFPSAEVFLEALRGAAPGAIPSRRTPFSVKTDAARAGGDATPVGAAGLSAADPAPTKTSWTSRDGSAAPPPADSAPDTRKKLALMGVASAALAFLLTLVVLALRPKPPTALPEGAGSSNAVGSSAPVGVVVALRLVGPAGTRVLVDGKVAEDGVLRGPAMTRVRARVEAAGYEPREESFVLDGRAEARVDLVALPTPPSGAGGAGASAGTGAPMASLAKAGGKPATPTSATTTKREPPPTKDPAGLKLKVDP